MFGMHKLHAEKHSAHSICSLVRKSTWKRMYEARQDKIYTWPHLIEINRMCPAFSFFAIAHIFSMLMIVIYLFGARTNFGWFLGYCFSLYSLSFVWHAVYCGEFCIEYNVGTKPQWKTSSQYQTQNECIWNAQASVRLGCVPGPVPVNVCVCVPMFFGYILCSIASDWFYASWNSLFSS